MKSSGPDQLSIGPRLTFAIVIFIVLIAVGNGLVIWQFRLARIQTDRLTGANQQLIAILQLQISLLSFQQRLDDLAQSSDAQRLMSETESLRGVLSEEVQQTRIAIANLPTDTRVDPSLLTILESIQVTLPAHLQAINELAKSGDWGAIKRRVGNELKPLEMQTSVLVDRVDQQARVEIGRDLANMRRAQNRILILVPTTAIATFCIAGILGGSVARTIVETRLEERVRERTRIARDLHDTLLQSFHGLMLRFQTVSQILPEGEAKQRLDSAIDQAAQAITEGRDAVQDLRTSAVETKDLPVAIRAIGEELSAHGTNQNAAVFQVAVEGTPRNLHPILRDEVYRIAAEALRNAFRHALAHQIEVEVRYDQTQFRLHIRDDGRGIDPKVLGGDGRAGHYGLPGMRERAKLIGGKLTVWSEHDSGTEVELSIPAPIAYATSPRRSWLSEKFSAREAETKAKL